MSVLDDCRVRLFPEPEHYNTAVFSKCLQYRYRLDRFVQPEGIVIAYFGINGSTATATVDDQTVRKWIGFTQRNGGSRFIVGNVFGYRATDVHELSKVPDPVGPENAKYLDEIIAEADLLVPCWGAENKVQPRLRHFFYDLCRRMRKSGKPVKVFGWTKSGDPKHPLMLGYDTPLVDWDA